MHRRQEADGDVGQFIWGHAEAPVGSHSRTTPRIQLLPIHFLPAGFTHLSTDSLSFPIQTPYEVSSEGPRQAFHSLCQTSAFQSLSPASPPGVLLETSWPTAHREGPASGAWGRFYLPADTLSQESARPLMTSLAQRRLWCCFSLNFPETRLNQGKSLTFSVYKLLLVGKNSTFLPV